MAHGRVWSRGAEVLTSQVSLDIRKDLFANGVRSSSPTWVQKLDALDFQTVRKSLAGSSVKERMSQMETSSLSLPNGSAVRKWWSNEVPWTRSQRNPRPFFQNITRRDVDILKGLYVQRRTTMFQWTGPRRQRNRRREIHPHEDHGRRSIRAKGTRVAEQAVSAALI